MKKDRIEYFTGKLTSGNMVGIICTMYEIFFEYIEEAKSGDSINLEAVRKANKVLDHLREALDFKFDISYELFSIYDYCQRQLSKAMYKNEKEPLEHATKLIKKLYEAFVVVEKEVGSPDSAMQNSQQVTAGMTYGRNDLNEVIDNNNNRGFLA